MNVEPFLLEACMRQVTPSGSDVINVRGRSPRPARATGQRQVVPATGPGQMGANLLVSDADPVTATCFRQEMLDCPAGTHLLSGSCDTGTLGRRARDHSALRLTLLVEFQPAFADMPQLWLALERYEGRLWSLDEDIEQPAGADILRPTGFELDLALDRRSTLPDRRRLRWIALGRSGAGRGASVAGG